MDYEKKYNEALSKCKAYINDTEKRWSEEFSRATEEIFKEIFPELRESEDERIRKKCIELIKRVIPSGDNHSQESKEILDCISYLEKQKEQIPYTDFIIKPHKGDDNNPYDMRVSEAQEYAIKRGFGIPFNDGDVYVDERHITQTIGNILRWADEHPKEQKPAEWSEDDENVYKTIMDDFNGITQMSKAYKLKAADFLKSLRPQPHWKPSEEQVKALKTARNFVVDDFSENPTLSEILKALQEQLEKLM